MMIAANPELMYCSAHATAPVPPESIRMPPNAWCIAGAASGFSPLASRQLIKTAPAMENRKPDNKKGGIDFRVYKMAR